MDRVCVAAFAYRRWIDSHRAFCVNDKSTAEPIMQSKCGHVCVWHFSFLAHILLFGHGVSDVCTSYNSWVHASSVGMVWLSIRTCFVHVSICCLNLCCVWSEGIDAKLLDEMNGHYQSYICEIIDTIRKSSPNIHPPNFKSASIEYHKPLHNPPFSRLSVLLFFSLFGFHFISI